MVSGREGDGSQSLQGCYSWMGNERKKKIKATPCFRASQSLIEGNRFLVRQEAKILFCTIANS